MTEFGDKLSSLPVDEENDSYNEDMFSNAFGIDIHTIRDTDEKKTNTSTTSKIRKWAKIIVSVIIAMLLVRSPQIDDLIFNKITKGGTTKIGVKALLFVMVVLLFHFL